MHQQQHHSQHQQQRSSFFRANRPGNLNIVEVNESLNQVQQIQQSPLINSQQQQILMPPSSPYMNQNYMTNQNKIINQSPLGPPLLPPPHTPTQSTSYSNHITVSTPNQQQSQPNKYNMPSISPVPHHLIQQQPSSPSYIVQTNNNNFQPQYSPSYTTSTTNNNNINNNNNNNNNSQSSNLHLYSNSSKSYDQQQTYTPTYSPCQSSANIINKQSQYFNFDLSNINNITSNTNPTATTVSTTTTNNNSNSNSMSVPQSPRLFNANNNNNSINNMYSGTSITSNNLNQVTRYSQQQYNTTTTTTNTNNNSNNGTMPSNNGVAGAISSQLYQFQHNYHKMPSTPQSAIPISSNNNQMFNYSNHHSLSVPNSPIISNNNNNNMNQNSMFHFNNVPAQQHMQSSLLQDSTPSVLKFKADEEPQFSTTYQNEKMLNTSYEFETNMDENDADQVVHDDDEEDDEINGDTIEDVNAIKEKTYGENEIEMVEQVLNAIQKEESIKDTLSSNSVDSATGNCESIMSNVGVVAPSNLNNFNNDSTSDHIIIKSESQQQHQLIHDQHYSHQGSTHLNFSQYEQTLIVNNKNTNTMTENVLIKNSNNNNATCDNEKKIMNHLNKNQCNEDNNKKIISNSSVSNTNDNTKNATNNNKNSVVSNLFSLSNLSAAASAEFESLLNFNSTVENKDRSNNNNIRNTNSSNKLVNKKQHLQENNSSLLSVNSSIMKSSVHNLSNEFHKSFMNLNSSSKKYDQLEMNSSSLNKKDLANKCDSIKMNMEMQVVNSTNENSFISDNSNLNSNHHHQYHHNHNSNTKSAIDKDINSKFSVIDQQQTDLNNEKKSNTSSIHSDEFSMPNSVVSNSGSNIQNCLDCGKIFTNKSALAKHKLIHSNERKYACHLCDKSFKRQDHLNGHLLTHQDKKPFECKAPGCDKSYCDSRSLKRHVESQHQDYLEAVARGNHQVLNYLPNIGKLKANLAPNLQHEIIVNEAQNTVDRMQYSPITPVINTNDLHTKSELNEPIVNSNGRPKNFFTFEEPKPEACRICGKGFKNIPALNGHMRLHGGFIKTTKPNSTKTNNSFKNNNDSLVNNDPYNEDSLSSNCSSNNSFQSNKDFKAALKDYNNKHSERSTNIKLSHHPQQQSQSFNLADNSGQTHSLLLSKLKPQNQKKNSYQKMAQCNLIRTNGFRPPDSNSKMLIVDAVDLDLLQQNSNDSQSFEQNYNENKEYKEYDNRSDQMISSQLNDNLTSNSPFNYNSEEARFKNNLSTNPFYYNNENKTFINDSFSNPEVVISKTKQLNGSSNNKLKIHGLGNEPDNSSPSFTPSKYISNLLQSKQSSFESYIAPSPSASLSQQAKSFVPTNNSIPNTNNGQERLFDLNPQNENKTVEDSYSYENIYQPKINNSILNQPWTMANNQNKPKNDCLSSKSNNNGNISNMLLSLQNQTQQQQQQQQQQQSDALNSANSQSSSSNSSVFGIPRISKSNENKSSLQAYTSFPANSQITNSLNPNLQSNSNNNNDIFSGNESQRSNSHYSNLSANEDSHQNKINDINENSSRLRDAITNALFLNRQTDTPLSITNNNNNNNNNNNDNNNNHNKQKIKPSPLSIPSSINAIHQQNQINYFQQQAANSIHQNFSNAVYAAAAVYAAHIYPNATLLKSPRLFNHDFNSSEYNFNYKKQYTPPPMLSPFRKGTGLFWNSSKQHLASYFSQQHPSSSHAFSMQQTAFRPTPIYQHSISENHLASTFSNFQHHLNSSFNSSFINNVNNVNTSNSEQRKRNHSDSSDEKEIPQDDKFIEENANKAYEIDESNSNAIQFDDSDSSKSELVDEPKSPKQSILSSSSSYLNTKPSLKRPRISSQSSHVETLTSDDNNLSDEAKAANETIAAALSDLNESNIKPFINEGDDYQAKIPKLRKLNNEIDYLDDFEDLMCSSELLGTTFQTEQFENYLQMVSKSSLVYGSSNNLELGLHILSFFNGNFEKAIKTFLNDSIDLPSNHPICNYKYNETEIWSQKEIKLFEKAILQYDKSFSEISSELKTKTTKQCIEFYYLWKKVMSDGMRKKWRSLKKNRKTANSTFETSYNNENGENSQEISTDSGLNDKINKNKTSKDSKSNSIETEESRNLKNGERFECVKCNLLFKTNRKLKSHLNQRHNGEKRL